MFISNSLQISMKESVGRPKIPRQLTDRFTNLTEENWEFNAYRSCWYLSFLLCALIFKLVSKPTVSSSKKSFLSFVTRRRSRRNMSPVIMQGERKPGRSTYKVEPTMDWKEFAINFNAELWRHVKRPSSRYVLQLAATCNRLSGRRENEQLEVWLRFHLARFLRVANGLFKHWTAKLKMLRGMLLWTSDHLEFPFLKGYQSEKIT